MSDLPAHIVQKSNGETVIDMSKAVARKGAKPWVCLKRYLVWKGGRASVKTTTVSLKIISEMMEKPLSNTLVVRQKFTDHRQSTWEQLKWAVNHLRVSHLWRFGKSPLIAEYKPTGQQIYFRGLDDPDSITSISVAHGYITRVWVEEAFQVKNEEDFDKLDGSIRGQLPHGYFHQIILTFNPWVSTHWTKERFFPNDCDFYETEDILGYTTTYMDNEFLSEKDIVRFEALKKIPKRYRVEGLGKYGVLEGLVFDNFETDCDFDYREIIKENQGIEAFFGLDFGYTVHPSAFVAGLINAETRQIWIFYEIYSTNLKNNELAAEIIASGFGKENIVADGSEPKSIDEMRDLYGVYNIVNADKGHDSIRHGNQFLQQFKIKIHISCKNTASEFNTYAYKKVNGKYTIKPIDQSNHTIDAIRYGCEKYSKKQEVWYAA